MYLLWTHLFKIPKWILVPLELYMKKHFWISLPLGPSEPRGSHICHCASFQTPNESRKLWYLCSLIYVTAYLSKFSKFETYFIYLIIYLPKQVRQFSGSHISQSVSLNKWNESWDLSDLPDFHICHMVVYLNSSLLI